MAIFAIFGVLVKRDTVGATVCKRGSFNRASAELAHALAANKTHKT